jgi:NADH:ubiquinone reductase (H+-translocating)
MEEMKNIPEKGIRKRVVIIGGGFAGLKLARCLDRKIFQVILLDKNNYHQFQPLFYQVATAGIEPSSIAFPFRKVFRKDDAFYFRLCTASRVIHNEKIIETDIGALEYDHLVIATGCDTNFFGNADLKESALTLKTISEALYIRNHILQSFEKALNTRSEEEIDSLLSFVIVGGGPTGVELAGALAEMRKYILPKDYPELDQRKMKVTIIDATSKLLGSMSEKASRNALRFIKKLSAEVRLNCTVEGYTDNQLELGNGERIRSSNVFWVAGIKGNSIEGISPETYTKGARLSVDSFNRVRGYEDIYAIGDNCLMTEEKFPGGHPQVAQVAIQQAKTLAGNLKNISRGRAMRPFRYSDKGSMATIGRNLAVADIGFIRIGGFPAWALWLFVHLMSIVGTKNRLFIFLNWMWSYFTFDQSLRLLIKTKNEGLE